MRALGFVLALLASAGPALGGPLGPGEHREFPCPGCITRVPAGKAAPAGLPLLVVLHGDGGALARLVGLLRGESERRGFVLLVPACPRESGCKSGSWWRWAGPPSWLVQQVEAVARAVPLDRRRIFLMGWSGGASYLAYAIGRLPATFAAIALAGGGMPSEEDAPCASWPAPVFFVSGDRNPLRDLAVAARERMLACRHEVRWVPLQGADHDGEWQALSRGQVAAMFDFFAAHPLPAGTSGAGGQ